MMTISQKIFMLVLQKPRTSEPFMARIEKKKKTEERITTLFLYIETVDVQRNISMCIWRCLPLQDRVSISGARKTVKILWLTRESKLGTVAGQFTCMKNIKWRENYIIW